MAWRNQPNQPNQPNMTEEPNKFDKFFKKNDVPNTTEEPNKFDKFFKKKDEKKNIINDGFNKVINKKYNRFFQNEDTSDSQYHQNDNHYRESITEKKPDHPDDGHHERSMTEKKQYHPDDDHIDRSMTEKKPYHPDDDHQRRNDSYNNRHRGSYNNNRSDGSYNNNNFEGSYNNHRRREDSYNNNNSEGSYNNHRHREGSYNNRPRRDDNYSKKSSPIQKQDSYNKIDMNILNIEKELNSDIYISQKKKDELTEKLNKLKEDKKNEFPDLRTTDIRVPVVNSVWSKMPSNIKSTKGIDEANKNTQLSIKAAKINNTKKVTKDIYEEHVESDYDGDDFIDDGFYEDDL